MPPPAFSLAVHEAHTSDALRHGFRGILQAPRPLPAAFALVMGPEGRCEGEGDPGLWVGLGANASQNSPREEKVKTGSLPL